MKKCAALLAAFALACTSGCTPGRRVEMVREAFYPPFPQSCAIKFARAGSNPLGDSSTEGLGSPQMPGPFVAPADYEVIGRIGIIENGEYVDPFNPEYIQLIRPRACAMGGQVVAVLASGSSQQGTYRGLVTLYGVLRRRPATKPNAPTIDGSQSL